MKKKMDFVINKTPLIGDQVVFRFYPRKSHVHGFGDKAPEEWNGVFKVYYSWKIFNVDNDSPRSSSNLFTATFDECSELVNLPMYIKDCIENKDSYYYSSFGDGVSWKVTYCTAAWFQNQDLIEFECWDRVTNKGYKFRLYIDEAMEFINYLDEVNKYMLQHSEGI